MAAKYRIVDNSQETKIWLDETFTGHPLDWQGWGPKDVVEDMVTYMMSQGWQPQGGLAITDVGVIVFTQAMTKAV